MESPFQIYQGENPWSLLPTDVVCEIIGLITDLDDLKGIQRISQTFERFTRLSIRQINSKKKVIIPVIYFSNFRNLQIVGDNIILEIQPKDLSILYTMSSLTTANFHIGTFDNNSCTTFSNIIITILEQLNLNRKFPFINIRLCWRDFPVISDHPIIVGYPTIIGLILQGNRFTTIGLQDILPQTILHTFHQLEYISLPDKDISNKILISRKIKDFFQEGEFGLIDPSQPPSDSNLPLTYYLRRQSNSGLVIGKVLRHIFSLYIFNNQLSSGQYITPDALLNRLFGEFLHDNFLYSHLSNLLMKVTRAYTINDISNYDVPVPLFDHEYDSIDQAIQTAHGNMIRFKNENRSIMGQGQSSLKFYLSDGSVHYIE